jgi:hypothetical protein
MIKALSNLSISLLSLAGWIYLISLILLLTSCATNKPSLQEVERLCSTGHVGNYHYSDDESNMRINCQGGKNG